MAFPTGWSRRCALVIDHTKVPSDQTNFPVLLTEANFPSEALDADGGNGADNGGGDLRFSSDSAGTTQLACEVVSYVTNNNPALGTAEVYVKVPTVATAADTTIYVWYHNPGQTQPAASDTYGSQNVWDSNYLAVYHGNSTADSTSNARTLTNNNSSTFVAGKVGNAFSFASASSQSMSRASVMFGSGPASTRTIECWMNGTSFLADGNGQGLVGDGTSGGDASKCFLGLNGDNLRQFNRDTAATSNDANDATNLSTSTWYYVASRIQANGKTDGMYRDASSVASATTNNLGAGAMDRFAIGAIWDSGLNNFFDGKIDEVRCSNIERSANYLTTVYNNTNAPATFTIEGTPDSVAAAASTRSPSGGAAYGGALMY